MGPPADERLVRDLAHGRFAPAPHTPVPHAAIARAPVPAAHAPAPHAPYPYTPAPPHAPAHHAPAANMFVPARDAHTFTPAPNPHAFAPAPTPHAPQAPLEALQAGPVGLSREVAAQQPLPAVRGRKKATKQPANAAEGTKQSGVRRTWPFDARELFQIAQAALETSVVSAPQGAKGKTQDAFTELVNGQGIVGSKGTFLQHLDDLIEYHAVGCSCSFFSTGLPWLSASYADHLSRIPIGSRLSKPLLRVPATKDALVLLSIVSQRQRRSARTKQMRRRPRSTRFVFSHVSHCSVANLSLQKQLEDKRGGNAIRLNSLMNRRTKASINPDSHFFHDDNHDADEPRARSHSPPPVDDAPVPATTPTPAAPRDPIAVTPDPRTRLSPVPAGAAAGTSNAGRPPTPSTPTKTKDSGTPKSSPRRRQGKSSKGPKSPSKSKKRPAEPTTPDAGERRTKRRRKDLSDPPAWVLEDRERREAQHDEAMNEARRSNQNAERNNDLFERSLQDTRNFQNDFLTLLAGRLNQPRRQIA